MEELKLFVIIVIGVLLCLIAVSIGVIRYRMLERFEALVKKHQPTKSKEFLQYER